MGAPLGSGAPHSPCTDRVCPGKTKARVPSGVTEQDCSAFPTAQPAAGSWEAGPGSDQQCWGFQSSWQRAPEGTTKHPKHPKLDRSAHKAPGRGCRECPRLYSLTASLCKASSASSSYYDTTQQFLFFLGRFAPRFMLEREKAVARSFHSQPHTTLTGVRDAPLKRGFEVP